MASLDSRWTARESEDRSKAAVAASLGLHALTVAGLLWAGTHLRLEAPLPPEPVELMFAPALPAATPADAPPPDPATAEAPAPLLPPAPAALATPAPPDAIQPVSPDLTAPAPPTLSDPVQTAAAETPPPAVLQAAPEPDPPQAASPALAVPDTPLAADLPLPEPPLAMTRPSPIPVRAAPPRPSPPHPARAHPRPPEPDSASPAGASPALPAPAAPLAPSQVMFHPPAPLAAAPVAPSWSGAVAAWLAAHKRYPETARAQGEEGVVGVMFTVARDGRVLAVAIPRSSGSARLDTAVRDMLEGQRLPPFPPDMLQPQTEVRVNIRYALDR